MNSQILFLGRVLQFKREFMDTSNQSDHSLSALPLQSIFYGSLTKKAGGVVMP